MAGEGDRLTVIRHCPTCGPISVVKPGEPGWPVGQPWLCARDGEPLSEVEYVPAEQLRGAVEEAHAVAKELRELGEDYRNEYPDGRAAKRELNEIADRLDRVRGQS